MARRYRSGRPRALDSASRITGAFAAFSFVGFATRLPVYGRLVWELLKDERVPGSRKALLAGALGYVVLPWDIIPDRLPLVGALDDLVVVVLAIDLFLDGIPDEVLYEKLLETGIARSVFEEDMAQIRRVVPRPVRRLLRGLPDTIDAGAEAIRRSGLGPKLRAWINREEPIA